MGRVGEMGGLMCGGLGDIGVLGVVEIVGVAEVMLGGNVSGMRKGFRVGGKFEGEMIGWDVV